MNSDEALKLVRQYVFDKTGKRINTNDIRIMSDQRQVDMLKQAVAIAVKHYKKD